MILSRDDWDLRLKGWINGFMLITKLVKKGNPFYFNKSNEFQMLV